MANWIQPAMTDVPSSLIRFVEKEEYAISFISGEIRFGLLDRYRTLEDSRKDEMEGRPTFYWNKKAPEIIFDKRTGTRIGQGNQIAIFNIRAFP